MRLHHKVLFALAEPMISRSMERPNLILVVGCMRSGSSLLTHILTSNTEIAGFGESHVRYSSRRSLSELAYWILRFRRRWPGGRGYMLDKVLHREHIPDFQALSEWARLRVIFLIRGPEGNISSLQKMFDGYREEAERYYRGRLKELAADIEKLPKDVPALLVKYEDLTSKAESELARISAFLGLAAPLKPEYEVHSASGRWGVGDGSSAIKSGVILERSPGPLSGINSAMNETQRDYDTLLEALERRCDNAGAASSDERPKTA